MAVLLGNEACIAHLSDRNQPAESVCKSLGNLHQNRSDMESLCSLISKETRTNKIFVPEEMDLPLIDVSAALDAACGDIDFMVNPVT